MKKILFLLSILTLFVTSTFSQIKNLGENINSKFDEIRPVVSKDGGVMFYIVEYQNGDKFRDGQDIYMSIKNSDGTWSKSQKLPDYINSQRYNGVYWCSEDGKKILIRGGIDENTNQSIRGFSVSRFQDGKWSSPEPIIVKNYETLSRGKFTGATLSSDEKVLIMYFTSDINSEDNDLWVSEWVDTLGAYSEPKLLSISEPDYDEISPYISSDGKTLFYSSNRPEGLGGYDIWVVKRLDDSWNYWTKPENLGEPFNSKDWDAYFYTGNEGYIGYFSTNRKNTLPKSFGKTDLVCDTLPFYLIPEKSLKKFDENGNVINEITELGDSPYENSSSVVIHDTIQIVKVLPCNPLDTMSSEELQLELKKTKILFDFGSSVLRPEAYKKLDIVVAIMNKNTKMIIELGGHTDAIGQNKRNQSQSEERAESAKKYLLARGITSDRIVTKGYSNTKPVAGNETDAGRQLNRRVDIIVISQ